MSSAFTNFVRFLKNNPLSYHKVNMHFAYLYFDEGEKGDILR